MYSFLNVFIISSNTGLVTKQKNSQVMDTISYLIH